MRGAKLVEEVCAGLEHLKGGSCSRPTALYGRLL